MELNKSMIKSKSKNYPYEQNLLESIKAIAGDQYEKIIKLSKERGSDSFGSFEFYVALYLEMIVSGERLEDLDGKSL